MATAMYQDSRENIATVFVGGGRGCGRDEVRANRKPPEAVIHRLLSCPPHPCIGCTGTACCSAVNVAVLGRSEAVAARLMSR